MTVRKPESIIKTLIIGSMLADALLLILLSFHYSIFHNFSTLSMLLLGASMLAYLSLCALTLRVGRVMVSAHLIIIFYYLVAVFVSITQGITSPIGLLLYCFFILVGGVLFGSTYIVRTTTWTIVSLFTLQLGVELGLSLQSNTPSSVAEVTAYAIFYGVFALVGWLASSQIERALNDSLQAKVEILHQKNLLAEALTSEEYRRQRLQIEELGNLYQFAELGQQTTLLFHEFANQLTTLSLDIDEPTASNRRHAQKTLKEMNQTMHMVREKLSSTDYEIVKIADVLSDVIKEHRAKLRAAHIRLITRHQTTRYQAVTYGDRLNLRQILNVLIDNAIHAYAETKSPSKLIEIILTTTDTTVSVNIIDFGAGISSEQRKRLFKASHTTKLGGHGIGLFIAKRIIEQQFRGSIQLAASDIRTEFIIELPRVG